MYKFSFKNINISFKKFNIFLKSILNISKFFFEIFVYLNFMFNKASFILKKIFINILNNIKMFKTNYFNLKIISIIINKGQILKKYNYRAKGRTDIIKKKYYHIFLNLI